MDYERECQLSGEKPIIEAQMKLFLELCDRLQSDDNPTLKYFGALHIPKFTVSIDTNLCQHYWPS